MSAGIAPKSTTDHNAAWARVSTPVSGAVAENSGLEIAAKLAESFGAHLNVLFTPPDPAELAPWLGEGFMGTVQMAALDGLKNAADEAEATAREVYEAIAYPNKAFSFLKSPVWQDLATEVRLSDLVVFGADSARGRGLLAEAFQQVLMEERAGVFIARQPFEVRGVALVAWDGKEPSSRAARRAVPLLKKASRVVIAGAPVGDTPADLGRLAQYYAHHGLTTEIDLLSKGNDLVGALVEANQRHNAQYMVAGAFGRSRLREFAFGGTTRALLHNTSLNLYMAH